MEDSVTILIPCHNDCAKAIILKEKIKEQFPEFPIHILHNGCRDFPSRFNFANKAKAINSSIKYIKTEYVIVFDADIELSPFCIPAFLNAIEYGIEIGTSQVVFIDRKEQIKYIVHKAEDNGAAWFCKREILELYKIPENIIVEDTAFFLILKKEKIEMKIIKDAVCAVNECFDNFLTIIRRDVRYALGSLQVGIHFKSIRYFVGFAALLLANILILYISYISKYFIPIIVCLLLIEFLCKNINSNKMYMTRGIINVIAIPPIVLYLFVTKNRIW